MIETSEAPVRVKAKLLHWGKRLIQSQQKTNHVYTQKTKKKKKKKKKTKQQQTTQAQPKKGLVLYPPAPQAVKSCNKKQNLQ